MRAWIEIVYNGMQTHAMLKSLSSWERGLKLHVLLFQKLHASRSLHESVDWNARHLIVLLFCLSRSLHESVDWNFNDEYENIIVFMSLSSWERGLKYLYGCFSRVAKIVALFMRAWIEIPVLFPLTPDVAMSLSSWERGLKYRWYLRYLRHDYVALFMRAWIEISPVKLIIVKMPCRSLHESVDWNAAWYSSITAKNGRSLHESVDWNKTKKECRDWEAKSLSSWERGLKYL